MILKDATRVRVRDRVRLEGGGVDSGIITLDKKACDGLVWLYPVHPQTWSQA